MFGFSRRWDWQQFSPHRLTFPRKRFRANRDALAQKRGFACANSIAKGRFASHENPKYQINSQKYFRRKDFCEEEPQRRNIGLCACAKSCKQSLRRRRVRSVLCATAQCAVRTLRTKKSPFSAAISCPQAAHYLGAAKTVPRRGGRVWRQSEGETKNVCRKARGSND